MCGIVCGITLGNIVPVMLNGLKLLEYRGYDSAGMVALDQETGCFQRIRTEGKVAELERAIHKARLKGNLGVSQTRWATHGKPSEANAHPHMSEDVYVVHNGIIENHQALRAKLEKAGYRFETETDTETIPHLVHYHLSQQETPDLLKAVFAAKSELEGAFALGIISTKFPDQLIGVRQGSPLVVGVGKKKENFLASDPHALLSTTQKFIYLEDGDVAHLTLDAIQVYDQNDQKAERKIHSLPKNTDESSRGNYRHYMQKEMFEQSAVAERTLLGKVETNTFLDHPFTDVEGELAKVKRVHIVACGTSYHAGLVGQYWFQELLGMPCQVEVASEYRYCTPVVEPDTLFIVLSQSGETADTLGALHKAQELSYLHTLAICNVPYSAMTRAADFTLLTSAGTEIGVASTKSFTSQLIALLLLVSKWVKNKEQVQDYLDALEKLPEQITTALTLDKKIQSLAKIFRNKPSALFLGRGVYYPIAMEGALKLKELSYIHAEAYPSGELKHGPLALIDEHMPVVAIAPNDVLLSKLKSNLDEVRARGGELIIFTDETADIQSDDHTTLVTVPGVDHTITSPILYTIPLQLLSYHVAVLKGTDVDQPRNLAKSVTVE